MEDPNGEGGLSQGGVTYLGRLYKPTSLAHSSHSFFLSSLAWLSRLELCPRARGNSTIRTPSHCWISGPSHYSSVASLNRSSNDVYIPDVCRTTEVPPFVALVFIDLLDYTTLRSALVVSVDNVHAGTSFLLLVFKGMNTVAARLPYNYIE
jgi:hypothetical protein